MTDLRRWFLPAAVLLELGAIILGSAQLSAFAGGLFVLCFLTSLGRLQPYARVLLLLSLAVLAWFWASGALAQSQLLKAFANAAYYAAFLGSLGMMQCLASRFEVLRRIHDILLGGRPVWLYPKYALVSGGIASVLSFGMMSVLCGTLSETLRERGITGHSRLQWLRGVLVSALRGFALVPLVAPTSVAVAILTRELPALSWSGLLPYGAGAALLMIGVGWLLEQRRFREISSERVALNGRLPGTWLLICLVLVVFASMAALVMLAGLNVSSAAMLTVPAITLLYLIWRERSGARVITEAASQVSGMNNEMAIFSASAILGVAIAGVLPSNVLSGLVASIGGELAVAGLALLIMPLLSAVGIIPITVLSIQAGLLPPLIAEGMNPYLLSVALVIGFSLAMMLSPFGPSVMLLSRFGQVSKWVVAFRWNGAFVALVIPLALVLLAVWSLLLPAGG